MLFIVVSENKIIIGVGKARECMLLLINLATKIYTRANIVRVQQSDCTDTVSLEATFKLLLPLQS